MFFIVLSLGRTRQIGRAFTEIGLKELAKWGTSIVSQHIYLRLPSVAVTRTTSTHTELHTQTQAHTGTCLSNRSWHSACKYLLSDLRQHLSVLCPVISSYIYRHMWYTDICDRCIYKRAIYIFYTFICLSFMFTLLTNLAWLFTLFWS